MSVYYVRKTGSDGAAGTSAGAAWLTVDKAANTLAAGDTVYIGAGVYRELVTMDTSGSSGSQISYIGDVDGSQTGDAGLVIISAYDDDYSIAIRAASLDPDGRTFVTWRGVVFNGGTSGAVFSANATNDSYEGCTFEDCVFIGGNDVNDYTLDVDMNAATTPTNNGLTFDRCVFYSHSRLRFDGNATAEQNLKIRFNACVWISSGVSGSNSGFLWDIVTANTYGSGGLQFNNCAFIGTYYGINVDDGSATASFKVAAYNCLFYRCNTALNKSTDNDGALISAYNHFISCLTDYTNVTAGQDDRTDAHIGAPLFGGIADIPLYRFWGWSPYKPWEIMQDAGQTWRHVSLGAASADYAPAFDLYNNPSPQGSRNVQIYWFDVSDAGPTDNEAAWASDANAFDNDEDTATTTTAGSNSTNELFGEGTNAPSSGPTIVAVRVRVRGYVSSAANNTKGNAQVWTDGLGESLGTITAYSNTAIGWSDWLTLTTPSGGWTWAKIQALEIAFWKTADSGANTVYVARTQVEVQVNADDIGAVQARARPEKETTTVRTGSNALRFDGAGYHDIFVPVNAASTTVAVYGRYDTTYSGTLPQLKIMNIPGVADQTDTMAGGSGAWEELSINFTPTAAGVVRVRLLSSDTSYGGSCYFDDLTVT